jgi:hypothetical protein
MLLKTNSEPVALRLMITGKGEARIIARDADDANTVYIDRNKPLNGASLCVGLPISPNRLRLEVKGDCKFQASLEPLRTKPSVQVDSELWDWLDFAGYIAKHASNLEECTIMDSEEQFFALYKDRLFRKDGSESSSPARVSMRTGDMMLNRQMFQAYTVPMRYFIMLHERAHYELYSHDEEKCDLWALRLYLDLGFSPIEAIYAMGKVFADTNRNVQRTKKALEFIKQYER